MFLKGFLYDLPHATYRTRKLRYPERKGFVPYLTHVTNPQPKSKGTWRTTVFLPESRVPPPTKGDWP